MENSNNPYNYPVFHPDQPSSSTYMQQPLSNNNNNFNPQLSFNMNYMQQPMPNPNDITDPTTAMNMTLVLMAKAFKLNYSTPTNNKRISSNLHNRQILQPGMNMGQDRWMQMDGLIVVLGIANPNVNQNGNGNVIAARAEGNAIGNNGNKIKCYNYRGLGHYARNWAKGNGNGNNEIRYGVTTVEDWVILLRTAQSNQGEQASTSGTQTDNASVYDSNGSAEFLVWNKVGGTSKNTSSYLTAEETANESLAKHKALEFEIERLLKAVVSQDIMSIVQKCKYDKISFNKAYKDMQQKIKWLQAQLGDFKGKSQDTPCVSDTLDPLSQKLEKENVELEFHLRAQLFDNVYEQKDTTKGTSVNTKFRKQLILGKPPSSLGSKLYSVTPFPKSKGLPKIDESHALSKPVTSNSGRKSMTNKPIKVSVRTKPITVLQPHVITKKDVNSDSNGLSSTGVDNTVKTRRPQPRSNTKNDRVPSASKSSYSKNKEVEVEEHPMNLLLSKNKKHMSTECNNIKLAIQNDKSKDVCAMCIQCLITFNHDVCVLNYVNDMNSRMKKINANVSNTANKRKHNVTPPNGA
ncbi:hypothetical protein Tco_0908924 [Tanacetum coccineum]|uniref:Uncharacterized protein n=1 Tax=Tanacetum coccineum TaxID=301880 RepID=A0ABQ5CV05_9ASTR